MRTQLLAPALARIAIWANHDFNEPLIHIDRSGKANLPRGSVDVDIPDLIGLGTDLLDRLLLQRFYRAGLTALRLRDFDFLRQRGVLGLAVS